MIKEDPVKGNFIIHLVWDSIWPVRDRDLVVEVNSVHDWDNDLVEIILNDTADYPVPVEKGLIRVRKFYARFDFRYIDRSHTEVTFINLVDPGGLVPAGIADIQTGDVPYDTIRELGKRAADPVYNKRAFKDYY
jgi:hypothetical protein